MSSHFLVGTAHPFSLPLISVSVVSCTRALLFVICSHAIFTVRNLLWLKVKKQANKANTANNQATSDRATVIQTTVRQNALDVESIGPSLQEGSFYAMFNDIYFMFAALLHVR